MQSTFHRSQFLVVDTPPFKQSRKHFSRNLSPCAGKSSKHLTQSQLILMGHCRGHSFFLEASSEDTLWLFSTTFSTLPAELYSNFWKRPWSIWLEILSKSWPPGLFEKSHLIRTNMLPYSFLVDSWTLFSHKVRFSEFKSEKYFHAFWVGNVKMHVLWEIPKFWYFF